jgi:hypothetical protein
MGLGKILEGFIVIIVGVNLAPTVANQVAAATVNSNFTGASGTMLSLTVLFFSIGVMTAGIGIGVGGLQEIGLL